MQRPALLATLVLPALAFAQVHDEDNCGKARALRLLAEQGAAVREPGVPGYEDREAHTDTDLLHCDLDIEVLPASDTITGSNTMRVRSLVNNLTQFTFRLRSQYAISSLTVDGSPASASTPGANSYGRTVTLPRVYGAGEEFTIVVAYSGTAVSRGFGSITFGTQNGADIISTLSEAYFAGTWWPVKDGDFAQPGDNSDKFTFTLAVTAPGTLNTVSNGLPMPGYPQTLPGGRAKHRWRSDLPTATYLVCFSTTNYNSWSQTYSYPLAGGGTGSMPVMFHIYPASDTPANRLAWEKCLPMLATYRPIFGEYPFVSERYGIYQFPFGGGMEHQTSTGQGTFNESVTAHELAHQWWGDNVTCKTWNHIWLNEGFATYTEALWEERKPGSSGLPALQSAMNARRPSQVNDSVYVANTADMNRIFSSTFTYRKGGWALHQLRHLVGDDAFFAALQAYRAQHQGSAATTEDFRDAASAVAARDLDWFFQQWIYGVGAPAFAYGWTPVTINGNRFVKVSLAQTQDASWPGGGSPAGYFRVPLDVAVTTPSGTSTVTLDNDSRSEWYILPADGVASALAIDPRDWVLITDKVEATYVPGPPAVLSTSPAPGADLADAPATLAVEFSENVTIPAGSITLTGPGGAVNAAITYAAGTQTATVSPTATLAPGPYTLNVSPAVTANALALDGEWSGAFPSGNGQPGGAFTMSFTVSTSTRGCDPDYDQNGVADQDDVAYLINVISGGENPTERDPDFDQNGVADQDDVAMLIDVVAGGACP